MAYNFTKKTVLEAITGSAGVMEYVAVKLGCDWSTARIYVNKWDETTAAFDLAACKLHSTAYQSFITAIKAGDRWAVERVLDTSARRNGHGSVQHAHLDHTTAGESLKQEVTDEELMERLRELGIEC
jgi:hypothetical protein